MTVSATDTLPPRGRKVKTSRRSVRRRAREIICKLMAAGADAFRINMSHGDKRQKARLVDVIRGLEKEFHRPTTIVFDLQGPKLRVGHFERGQAVLERGQRFLFDRDAAPGSSERVQLPHPELFQCESPGAHILVDDGKVRLKVLNAHDDRIETEVMVGGRLSDNKGVNVPNVLLPISALTKKDRLDLEFALEQRADWIALSFVQRPEDVAEARSLIGERAALMAKIEKPAAIDRLNDIIALADGVDGRSRRSWRRTSARRVPPLQNRIVASAQAVWKARGGRDANAGIDDHFPPTSTRAEASDVATAIYDGADAVMLSAESAAGQYPVEAVAMMDRIAVSVERDRDIPGPASISRKPTLEPTTADALACSALRQIASTVLPRARWFATRVRVRPRGGSRASALPYPSLQ